MTVKWNMHLSYFGEWTESANVATTVFLCLHHAQHTSPFASFLTGSLLAFSTMDSDLPNGAALSWRRAVFSLEPAVCSEAACNWIFWQSPPPSWQCSIRAAFTAKYFCYIFLVRADNANYNLLEVLQREGNDAVSHRHNAAALVHAHVYIWPQSRNNT